MKPHSIHAAKTQLSRLLQRAEAGEDVVIARGNVAVVRLVRVAQAAPARKFGAMRGKAKVTAAFFEPLDADELARWE
jgi:antitoxin (DNA-binding transcriptional repressor) of toxin-antitoxin stability system